MCKTRCFQLRRGKTVDHRVHVALALLQRNARLGQRHLAFIYQIEHLARCGMVALPQHFIQPGGVMLLQ